MSKVIYVGMDVHKDHTSLVCFEPTFTADRQGGKSFCETRVATSAVKIRTYIEQIRSRQDEECTFKCGYEAGCLGFSLYKDLLAYGIDCTVLAPTTMLSQKGKRVKIDSRDALLIAQCLAYGTYSAVAIPTEEDESVRDYIRMCDDHRLQLKVTKQRINAFCLRKGKIYDGTKWTKMHIAWLKNLELGTLDRETLNSYLETYEAQTNRIERFEARIEELARGERYAESVGNLCSFLGVTTPTALAVVAETGDFSRFGRATSLASYYGLTPGEHSSGESVHREGITKAGNTHIRRLLVEASQSICRGSVGHKSKALKARQAGRPQDVVAYADKANVRMRSKYYRMVRKGVKRNIIVTAIARELSCFIWGMMTSRTA